MSSEINEPTLFGFTCSSCGHEGYVHLPDDADSNVATVECPECGSSVVAYSTALSQEERIALMEEARRFLDDTVIKDAMAQAGIHGVTVEQARELIDLVANRDKSQEEE
jgi:DNA-directed RNA polymerase subunit RPC12/RpoP